MADVADLPIHGIQPSGYMLPEETRLGRVRLQVSDLTRSVAYYRDVLGFHLISQDGPRAALGAHDADTLLLELREAPGATAATASGRLGLYHFAILLPSRADLGSLIAHLSAIGASVGASDHLVSEALYLHDPDGLGIEVYADRPRSAWQYEGRQIVMDTRPLAVPDLLRAAGGKPWRGMPAGTTLGHVHLHVGDIEAATAFFHAALGFGATVWSYPGALFLSAGGYHHHLGVNTWAGTGARRAARDDARLLEWEIVLTEPGSVADAAASMETAGFAVTRDQEGWVTEDPWGTSLRMTCARAE